MSLDQGEGITEDFLTTYLHSFARSQLDPEHCMDAMACSVTLEVQFLWFLVTVVSGVAREIEMIMLQRTKSKQLESVATQIAFM
jgi:hypothetical protein